MKETVGCGTELEEELSPEGWALWLYTRFSLVAWYCNHVKSFTMGSHSHAVAQLCLSQNNRLTVPSETVSPKDLSSPKLPSSGETNEETRASSLKSRPIKGV